MVGIAVIKEVARRVGSAPVLSPALRAILVLLLRIFASCGAGPAGLATHLSYTRLATFLGRGVRVHVRRRGLYYILDLDDNLQRALYYTGWYEREYLRWLESELVGDDVYIDIGGHIGVDALWAARHLQRNSGNGTVIAFEPAPDSANRLHLHAMLNDVKVDVVNLALGQRSGSLTLRAHPLYPHDAGMRSSNNTGEVVVEALMVSFDEWVKSSGIHAISVVKIDVEGSELDVLKGMMESLRRLQPRALVVEFAEERLEQAGNVAEKIESVLDQVGYCRSGVGFLDNIVFRPKHMLQ